MEKQAVIITTNDSLATATVDLKRGDVAKMFLGKDVIEITLKEDVKFGHKFAIKDIKKGEHVIKYNESIGVATKDISVGEHVHVHNVESDRGRGDKIHN
ncbi:Altronate dehydratase [Fusobacterium sp. DD29]|uniref:UxaA family hydrolase n=1 Tax=unclassified Fusobacterium TaxID=2648384 RepID=UPI001B8AA3B1|nr:MULTISPECIES: UxaA family hydrolase [unclassified Fusobacterium]MBR8700894.1 Altronate dehydratase [Fusobacterium sp. DD45]MBR8710642.1 Altronate dehydratase [Fusobacterium sp. DD28]MBR8748821.1 Altronate dehydratase [Fusobacterium sp. DD29]MBR8751244.1 Altronate dehydratase [Fusobacterium sp. DD26]MBR8761088.1 Altronate dehydratase [Fusobacterium sp. DD25]